MTQKLYLVRGNDVDGENQDWFVVATDTVGAISIWNDHLISNGFPRADGDDEEDLPRQKTFEPANIREILPDVAGTRYAGADRAIGWEELDIVFEPA